MKKIAFDSEKYLELQRNKILERIGMFEGKLYTLYSLVNDGVLTTEDAAARLGMTPEEFDEAVKAINTEGTT